MSDFDEKKAKAEGKCKGADTEAEKSKPPKKFGALQAAALAYVELADLWKPHNLVAYEENMQLAAERRRAAAAATNNAADKNIANDGAGADEQAAADALEELAAKAEAAKDPRQADAYHKKAKAKYDKAKQDFTNAGQGGKATAAAGKAAAAQTASDKLQPFVK
jgi:hypothetical protein